MPGAAATRWRDALRALAIALAGPILVMLLLLPSALPGARNLPLDTGPAVFIGEEMIRQEVHSQATILAKKDNFGLVACCPAGCYHLTVQNVSIRLTEKQYWALVGLLNESTSQLASIDSSPRIH